MSAPGCLDDGCACLECCQCECECLQPLREHRNTISSVVSGLLFAVGWWFLIDASVNDSVEDKHQAIGVFSTIGLFMVNAISADMIGSDLYSEGRCGTAGARVWLVIGLVMSFGSLIAAIWMAVLYIDDGDSYAGICLILQNVLIFTASFIFKFGRGDTSAGYSSFY